MDTDGFDDREIESIALGGTVERRRNGEIFNVGLKSQKMSFTTYQAELLVDALAEYSTSDDTERSITQKTQRQIMDHYDID